MARGMAGVILGLLLISQASAAEALYTARVVAPETLVRAKPSQAPDVYATNRLSQGAVVEVVGDRDLPEGWYAIKPPAGSFSWVNARFLQRLNASTWYVVTDPELQIPVRY